MKTPMILIRSMKLNQRFSLVVFGFALAPIVLLAWVLFGNTRETLIKDKTNEIAKALVQAQVRTERTAELCNMTRRVFLSDAGLREFLISAKSGAALPAEYLFDFYRDCVGSLEKLINANPYIYQVRVYYDNESLPEIMPILYHRSRMSRLSWAREEWVSGQWQLGYVDRIFPEEVMQPVPNIMSLVTEIQDYEQGSLGVLEVAVRMDDILPELYADSAYQRAAFVKKDGGTWLYRDGPDEFWDRNKNEIFPLLREDLDEVAYKSVSGDRMILCSTFLEPLDGWYIVAAFPREITAQLDGKRNLFFIGTALLLLLLAVAINTATKAILGRFYKIVRTVARVREGNLDVRVPDIGVDEVGALGEQFNQMLDRILVLMDENVKRQLLAKNSEIRALQSQINAHFIYNVLESIKMTAEVDHKYEIADSITSLGKLLRYSMQWTAENVPVADEIENAKNYLDLINLRFDNRIALRTDIPPDILRQKIPKLSLQPLVENAVVHGLDEQEECTAIEISAAANGKRLAITVTDYGRGIPADTLLSLNAGMAEQLGESGHSGKSIGLKNVNDRIVMAFGSEYGIRLTSEQNRRTSVTVCIPYSD